MSEKTVDSITSAISSLLAEKPKTTAKSANVKQVKKPKGLEFLQKRASQAQAGWYGLYHRKMRIAEEQGQTKQASKATDLILRGLSGVGSKVTGMGAGRGKNLAEGLLGKDLMRNMDDISTYLARKDTGTLAMKGMNSLSKSIGAGNIAKNIAMSPLGLATGVGGAGMLGSNLLGQSQGIDQVAEAFGNQPWYKQLLYALSMIGKNPDDIRSQIANLSQ